MDEEGSLVSSRSLSDIFKDTTATSGSSSSLSVILTAGCSSRSDSDIFADYRKDNKSEEVDFGAGSCAEIAHGIDEAQLLSSSDENSTAVTPCCVPEVITVTTTVMVSLHASCEQEEQPNNTVTTSCFTTTSFRALSGQILSFAQSTKIKRKRKCRASMLDKKKYATVKCPHCNSFYYEKKCMNRHVRQVHGK